MTTQLRNTGSDPIKVWTGVTDGDERIRERAVAAMVGRLCAEAMPFLVLRTADWPVRDRARAGLVVLLADDPAAYFVGGLADGAAP